MQVAEELWQCYWKLTDCLHWLFVASAECWPGSQYCVIRVSRLNTEHCLVSCRRVWPDLGGVTSYNLPSHSEHRQPRSWPEDWGGRHLNWGSRPRLKSLEAACPASIMDFRQWSFHQGKIRKHYRAEYTLLLLSLCWMLGCHHHRHTELVLPQQLSNFHHSRPILPVHIWVENKQEEVSKAQLLIFFFRAWLY